MCNSMGSKKRGMLRVLDQSRSSQLTCHMAFALLCFALVATLPLHVEVELRVLLGYLSCRGRSKIPARLLLLDGVHYGLGLSFMFMGKVKFIVKGGPGAGPAPRALLSIERMTTGQRSDIIETLMDSIISWTQPLPVCKWQMIDERRE
jgi:hypothetical protein